jgi:hypothetical protein
VCPECGKPTKWICDLCGCCPHCCECDKDENDDDFEEEVEDAAASFFPSSDREPVGL